MITDRDGIYPVYRSKFPELGFYAFPGAVSDTRSELEQIKYADQLGIGNVMISERADYKEIGTLCGATAAVTENIYIGTSATNANTRHPAFLAALATSVNRMSRGRFALGLGKGSAALHQSWGLPPVTFQREREYYDILKRLFRGEAISNYQGSIGSYPKISLLGDYVKEDIPILFVGFGPKSLQHAGTLYDGIHLHTFMDTKAVSRAVDLVRDGESKADRKSGSAKIWTVLATLCNPSEEQYLRHITARLGSYLQVKGYGEGLAKINDWPLESLDRFRNEAAVLGVNGMIDSVASLK